MTVLQELRLLLLNFLVQSMNKFNNKSVFQGEQFLISMLAQLNEALIPKLSIQLFAIFMFKMRLAQAVHPSKLRRIKKRFLVKYDKIYIQI